MVKDSEIGKLLRGLRRTLGSEFDISLKVGLDDDVKVKRLRRRR